MASGAHPAGRSLETHGKEGLGDGLCRRVGRAGPFCTLRGAVCTKGAVGQRKNPGERQPWAVPASRACRLLVSCLRWVFREGWGHRQGHGVKLVSGQGPGLLLQGTGNCRAGQQDGCPSPRGDVGAGRAAGSIACGLAMRRVLAWLPLLAGLTGGWCHLVTPCQRGELAGTSVQDNGAVQRVCGDAAAMLVLGRWEKQQHPAGIRHRGSPSPARGMQAGTPTTARLPRSPRPLG